MLTRVMQCPGPPCSLVLRAARDLPCQLLHAGMSGTLSRRYIKVTDGVSYHTMLHALAHVSNY